MNMKTMRSLFILFLGVLLLTMAVATVTQPAAAQACDPKKDPNCCVDAQGLPYICPTSRPENPNKKTPTPQRRPKTPTPTFTPSPTVTPVPTSTPTTVPPQPYPYPYPYPYPNPYPYPYPDPGGITPLDPPVLICLFCDKPWLWGIWTGVIFVIVLLGLLFYFRRRPFNLGPGGRPGPDPLPDGNENLTVTTPGEFGEGELLPAVQRGINENATMTTPGDVNGDGELVPAVQRIREAANNAGNAFQKADNVFQKADDAFIKGESPDPGDAFIKGE